MTEENTEQLHSVSGVDSCSPHIAVANSSGGETVIEGGVIPISELLPHTINEVESANTIFATAIPLSVNGSIPEGTILHITPDATIVTLEAVSALQSSGQFGNSTIILSESSQCSSVEALHASANESGESNENLNNESLTLDKTIEQGDSEPDSNLNSRNAQNIEEIDITGFLSKPEYENSASLPHDKSLGTEVTDPSQSSDDTHLGNVLERQDDLSQLPEVQQSEEQTHSEDQEVPANTDQTDQPSGNESNVVVVDISKPIQLSQNSLIVVNGQRCILQQDPQTGQVFAYPLREPDKPKRKRGRPRKVVNEVQQVVDGSSTVLTIEQQLPEEEESHERGMLEIANEDGTIVRRSTRKRKQANSLKDYETGNLKLVLGSEEEDNREAEEETPDEPETDSPPKKRGKGRGRPRKNAQPSSASPFSFLQPVKRGRGRPRRYGLPKESMQAFLIQTADGQAMMMQVPMSSIPSGMSLQDVAQGIANSLNTSFPQSLLDKVSTGNAKVHDKGGEDPSSKSLLSTSEQVQEVEMQDITMTQDMNKNDVSNFGTEESENHESLDTNDTCDKNSEAEKYNEDINVVQNNQDIHEVQNNQDVLEVQNLDICEVQNNQDVQVQNNSKEIQEKGQSDSENIHGMKNYPQNIQDIQNDTQNIQEAQNANQKINKMQDDDEDMPEVQNNNQGVQNDTRNLCDALNVNQEMHEGHCDKQDIHEIQGDNQCVQNEVQSDNHILNEMQNGNSNALSSMHNDCYMNITEMHGNCDTVVLQCGDQDTTSEIENFNQKVLSEINFSDEVKNEARYAQDIINDTNVNNDIINEVLIYLLKEVETILSVTNSNKNCEYSTSSILKSALTESICKEKRSVVKVVQNISKKNANESSIDEKSSKKEHISSDTQKCMEGNIAHSPLTLLTVPFKPKRRPGRPRKHPFPSVLGQTSSQKSNLTSESSEITSGNKSDQQITKLPIITSVLQGASSETSVVTTPATVIPLPEKLLPLLLPKSESPVKLGLKANETELEKLHCPRCDFQAYYLHQYQEHLVVHAEEAFQCKCCSFLCFDDDELIQHYKDHHPRCICYICNHTAEHAYIIKRHMYRHSDSGCCCDICGKTYKDHYILKMHVKMVHMPAEVLFECNVCNKKFNRKAHLKRHLRTHDPDKPFKCDLCDYRGCEKSDITKHTLIHEEPKHACEVCGKAFRHLKNKELHLKRHKGQRDYKCGICEFYGYTFTDIRKHIERRHSDPRTIFCNQCGQVFKSEELLKVHQDSNQCEVFMIEQSLDRETVIHIPTDDDVHIDENIDISSVQLSGTGDQEITGIATITLEDGSVATLNTLANIQDSAHIVVKSVDGSSVLAPEDTQIVVSGLHSSGVIMPNGQLAIMSEEGRSDTQVALMTTDGEECRTIQCQESVGVEGSQENVETYILPTIDHREENHFSSEHITMVAPEGLTLNGVTLDEGKVHQQVQIIGIS